MGNNFYQTNNEILKLDPANKNDLDYIIFNQYISRKENLQRIKNTLDRGLFKLSYTTIEKDLGFSRWKVQKIMKYFEDNGIIKCIEKSSTKGKESIYAYTSVYYSEENAENNTNCNTNYNTNYNTNKYSNYNGLRVIDNTNYNTNCNTSKKEKEKRKIVHDSSFTSTKSSYTDKQLVECRYKGLTVTANRFNGKCKEFKGNVYIEHNGYVYEIFKNEVDRVNNYWISNPDIPCCKFDSKEDTYKSKEPFKELRILDNKKAPAGTGANGKTLI